MALTKVLVTPLKPIRPCLKNTTNWFAPLVSGKTELG